MAAPKFSHSMHEFAKLGKFSDCMITSQGREFKLHKIIICPQSPVLSAALDGNFKESITNTLKADDFEPIHIQAMIDYLYTDGYTAPQPEDATQDPNYIRKFHIRVNGLADYYQIPTLATLSQKNFRQSLENISPKELPPLLQEAIDHTNDDDLIEVIVTSAATRIKPLLASQEFSGLNLPTDFMIRLLKACVAETELAGRTTHEQHQAEKVALMGEVNNSMNTCNAALRQGCTSCKKKFGCQIHWRVPWPREGANDGEAMGGIKFLCRFCATFNGVS